MCRELCEGIFGEREGRYERHKTAGDFYIPAQPKVYFVIPECGHLAIWDSMADPVSLLSHPNLATFFNYSVFKSTRMTQQMLRFVEPYITYGYALF